MSSQPTQPQVRWRAVLTAVAYYCIEVFFAWMFVFIGGFMALWWNAVAIHQSEVLYGLLLAVALLAVALRVPLHVRGEEDDD